MDFHKVDHYVHSQLVKCYRIQCLLANERLADGCSIVINSLKKSLAWPKFEGGGLHYVVLNFSSSVLARVPGQ